MLKRSKVVSVLLVVCLITLSVALGGISSARAQVGPGANPSALPSSAAVGLTYQWHTFYSTADTLSTDVFGERCGVAVDGDGNVYVTGYVTGTWGAPLHAYSGGYDMVVTKLNSMGQYQWHTFYGASPTLGEDGDDESAGLSVDADGNVYVTGYSDRTWLGDGDTEPLNPHSGGENMFVLKLNSDGEYQWHTFYQSGRAKAIALDSSGNVYVTGYSAGEWGTPLHSAGDNGHVVVIKLDGDGAYQWHTYYGAGVFSGDEAGYGITTDSSGNVYVTGTATDTWQGDGGADPLNPFSGGAGYSTDIVVLKLSSSGAYQWHTFYGASEYDDVGSGISWGNGGVYVTGESFDTWGEPLHDLAGERDIAVLKLDSAGQIQWNTFYGGAANDFGSGIAVAADGTAYVAGWSSASWLGDGGANPAHPFSGSGGGEIAVLKLDSSGRYLRHTFYGADGGDDYGVRIALDGNYGVFVTGVSTSTWLGDGGAAPLYPYSGNLTGDCFVLKLSERVHSIYLPSIIKNYP